MTTPPTPPDAPPEAAWNRREATLAALKLAWATHAREPTETTRAALLAARQENAQAEGAYRRAFITHAQPEATPPVI